MLFPYPVETPDIMVLDLVEQICPQAIEWEIRRELQQIQLYSGIEYALFSQLSAGEQTKVLLAALFLGEQRFLLLDEPTNHLDIQARKAVAEYLQKKSGFIVVSHDQYFLDSCIDHVLYLGKNRVEIHPGSFSQFLEQKERQEQYEQQQNKKLKQEIQRLQQAAHCTTQWAAQMCIRDSYRALGNFRGCFQSSAAHISQRFSSRADCRI